MWSMLFLIISMTSLYCKSEILVDYEDSTFRRNIIAIMNITAVVMMILTIIFMVANIR